MTGSMKKSFLSLLAICFISTAQARSVTVSGISSGAYFAHQFHVANSSWVSGAGILAGGPFYCAKSDLERAFTRCMDISQGEPSLLEALQEAKVSAQMNLIDPLNHLASSRVYILTGTQDHTVVGAVVRKVDEFYRALGVPAQHLRMVDDMAVGHAFPTLNFGNPCNVPTRAPWISNCHRDITGEILAHVLGVPLHPKVKALATQLFHFDQGAAGGVINPMLFSMAGTGYAYVPKACQGKSTCSVHVAFHGCRQTIQDIGDTFVTKTGYLEWAEANDLVVLFPQAMQAPWVGNPRGCWDWWGYTGPLYHTQAGPQMSIVKNIVEAFLTGKAELTR